jgi:hypothetical protein
MRKHIGLRRASSRIQTTWQLSLRFDFSALRQQLVNAFLGNDKQHLDASRSHFSLPVRWRRRRVRQTATETLQFGGSPICGR